MAAANTEREIDRVALRRVQQRWAAAADPPWLHGEVARRMAERLGVVRQVPSVVIDWWSHAGGSVPLLRAAYPRARLVRVEPHAAPAQAASPWWTLPRRRIEPAIDMAAVADAQAQLLWANMMLHALVDPAALLGAWQRALAVDGFLMFSTLGPDTLKT